MLLRACWVAVLIGKSVGAVFATFPNPIVVLLMLLMRLVTSENDANISVMSCCVVFCSSATEFATRSTEFRKLGPLLLPNIIISYLR